MQYILITYFVQTRGSVSVPPYNIAGHISEVSEEVATQIDKNCRRRQPHCHLRPRQEEPSRISACTLYFQKLESLAYTFVADSMGLSSFKFVQWAPKTHLFCNRVRFGRSRWFTFIQGRWF